MGGKNISIFLELLTGLNLSEICPICLFFVGSMPKNFGRFQLSYLKFKDYFICEKK